MRMSAAIIVKLTYGFDVAAEDDDLVEQISKPSSRGAKAGVPGLSPPDLLPFRMSALLFSNNVLQSLV